MALRDQPYLPLYIQDFLTDEKLSECSASATGVYIRIMCIMHKSENYGTILLKQKHKQTDKQILNFASMIAKNMPYDLQIVIDGLTELLEENVLKIEGDYLVQKRMVSDGKLSDIRALTGSKGGKKTQKNNKDFASDFPKANIEANTEDEIENENTVFNTTYTVFYEKAKNLFPTANDERRMLIAKKLAQRYSLDEVNDIDALVTKYMRSKI